MKFVVLLTQLWYPYAVRCCSYESKLFHILLEVTFMQAKYAIEGQVIEPLRILYTNVISRMIGL